MNKIKFIKMGIYAALLFLVIGLAVPIIQKYVVDRTVEVDASAANLYELDFKRDWEAIKTRLELTDGAKLEDLKLYYEDDGSIREYRFRLVQQESEPKAEAENFSYYRVDFSPQNNKYMIKPSRLERWAQYDRMAAAERLFEIVSGVDANRFIPMVKSADLSEKYEWYVLSSRGELTHYGVEDRVKYQLRENRLENGGENRPGNWPEKRLETFDNSQLPVTGHYLSLCGMVKMDEISRGNSRTESYECRGNVDILYDLQKNAH